MNKKALIILLLFITSTAPALADTTTYQARLLVEMAQSGVWVSTTNKINLSESWAVSDISIKYNQIESTNDRIWFTVSGSNLEVTTPLLVQGGMVCLRGTCDTNASNATTNAIRMTLQNIIPLSTTDSVTNTTSTSDNPVYAYVYYDRELPMAEGKINNFNGEDYVKQTGWTTEGGVSEVNVYFQRKDTSIPMAISVKAESEEPKVIWTDRTAKYTIKSNGKYVFTINYETKSIWGRNEEFTNVYTLVTTGMSSVSGAGNGIVAEAPYTTFAGDEFIMTMSTVGKFEPQTGVSVIDAGNRKFGITFEKAGQYELNFKSDAGGTAIVKFSVKPKGDTVPTPTPVTGNQQQPNDGDSGSLLWYILLVIAVIGIAYMLLSRRKKSANYTLHSKPQ